MSAAAGLLFVSIHIYIGPDFQRELSQPLTWEPAILSLEFITGTKLQVQNQSMSTMTFKNMHGKSGSLLLTFYHLHLHLIAGAKLCV